MRLNATLFVAIGASRCASGGGLLKRFEISEGFFAWRAHAGAADATRGTARQSTKSARATSATRSLSRLCSYPRVRRRAAVLLCDCQREPCMLTHARVPTGLHTFCKTCVEQWEANQRPGSEFGFRSFCFSVFLCTTFAGFVVFGLFC